MTTLPSRAIFLFDTLELGGAERQGLMVARHLKDEGVHVEVWGLTGGEGRLSRLCDQHGIPWRAVRLTWRAELAQTPRNVAELWRLARLLRAERPHWILAYTFFSNLVCGLVWRFTGADLCVWNQRDAGFYLDGGNPWRTVAARLTPCFIANSEQGRAALARMLGGREDVALIHNGVALGESQLDRAGWRASLGLSEDALVACMVSNLHANKDHATLVRAWREIPGAVLLLAGRLEETAAPTSALVDELALGGRVRVLGPVDDVAGLLGAVDLCVHSSRTEGLPNAVLEAMAAGLPVVATDLPGIREAVGPEGYRFLVPVGEPVPMSERIRELFAEPALRARVGEAMQQRARDEFDPKTMCRATVDHIARKWNQR